MILPKQDKPSMSVLFILRNSKDYKLQDLVSFTESINIFFEVLHEMAWNDLLRLEMQPTYDSNQI